MGQRKASLFKLDDIPSLGALTILVLSLLLLGADSPASSLFISALTFLFLGICMIARNEMSLRLWTVPFISIWAALTATHYVTGRTADAEYEYIGLLTAGSFFWFGRYTALSERRRRRVNRVIAVLALIYGVAVFIQHFALPNTILGHQNLLHQGRLTGTFLSANTAATLVERKKKTVNNLMVKTVLPLMFFLPFVVFHLYGIIVILANIKKQKL